MPKAKKAKKPQQTFEAKTLEEMVCHSLSHVDIHIEESGDYSVDVVCKCGERRTFARAAWERICEVIEKAAEAERADAGN